MSIPTHFQVFENISAYQTCIYYSNSNVKCPSSFDAAFNCYCISVLIYPLPLSPEIQYIPETVETRSGWPLSSQGHRRCSRSSQVVKDTTGGQGRVVAPTTSGKKINKNSNFLKKKINRRHTFGRSLIKCIKIKWMDPWSIVEDKVRTQSSPQMDGQTDKVKPVYPLSTLLKRRV